MTARGVRRLGAILSVAALLALPGGRAVTAAPAPAGPEQPSYGVEPAGVGGPVHTLPTPAHRVTGPRGPRGAIGPEGEAGPTGLAGSPGVQGVPGVQGAAGPAGPSGPQGTVGDRGRRGPRGARGAPGESAPANGGYFYTSATTDSVGSDIPMTTVGARYGSGVRLDPSGDGIRLDAGTYTVSYSWQGPSAYLTLNGVEIPGSRLASAGAVANTMTVVVPVGGGAVQLRSGAGATTDSSSEGITGSINVEEVAPGLHIAITAGRTASVGH